MIFHESFRALLNNCKRSRYTGLPCSSTDVIPKAHLIRQVSEDLFKIAYILTYNFNMTESFSDFSL